MSVLALPRIFLHRVFGLGKIPERDREALELEGIEMSYEGIAASLTFRNYRAPGRISHFHKRGAVGALVVTRKRFAAYAYSQKIFNVPLGDASLAKWKISVEKGRRLCLAGDASDLSPNQSGHVEARFTIPDAEQVARLLTNTPSSSIAKGESV